MPEAYVRRGSALAPNQYNKPAANTVRVHSTTDELKFGTGTSGTTEKTVVDSSTVQTLANKLQTFETVAAAGTTVADAGAAVSGSGAVINATGADATKGIKFPTSAAGSVYFVKNSDAANAILKVYAFAGGKINNGSTDAALSMAAKTGAVFVAIATDTWVTIPLLPS